MKKKTIYILLLLASAVHAQRYDNTWMWGIQPEYQDSVPFRGNGGAVFIHDTFETYSRYTNTVFDFAFTSFSDGNGELQFFTNGMRVKGTDSTVLQNGDSLNYGKCWNTRRSLEIAGAASYYVPQSHLTLPATDTTAYLFHIRCDTLVTDWYGSICYTALKKDTPQWVVTSKNNLLAESAATFGGIAACKHGNGRDWWFTYPVVGTNCVKFYLLTKDTLQYVSNQCLGGAVDWTEWVDCYFSLDGTKYVRKGGVHGTDVFNFDRCTGEISLQCHINPIFVYDTNGNIVQFAYSSQLSPNNKYFYANTSVYVYQFNLDTSDIEASKMTIGVLDNFQDTVPGSGGGPYYFSLTQYGIDGKIYLSPRSGSRWMHYIDSPNARGMNCSFRLRGKELTKLCSGTMPLYPNYRLGREIGSACDTVYSDVKPIYKDAPWLKVYPNPATDNVRLEYNWVEWEKISDCELRIADLEGRIVYRQSVPRYSTRQDVSVKGLVSGVYTVSISGARTRSEGEGNSQQPIAVCKLTVVD